MSGGGIARWHLWIAHLITPTLLPFRGDPPEPPVIPVVIMNKQQKSSPPPSDTAPPATADPVPEGSVTTASGTAAPGAGAISDPEAEEVALEGRFGLWESFEKLSPKFLRKRFDYRRTRSSSSLVNVAATNDVIARNFSLQN